MPWSLEVPLPASAAGMPGHRQLFLRSFIITRHASLQQHLPPPAAAWGGVLHEAQESKGWKTSLCGCGWHWAEGLQQGRVDALQTQGQKEGICTHHLGSGCKDREGFGVSGNH